MAPVILLAAALAAPPGFCGKLRAFVDRWGEDRAVEIARALKHSEEEIRAARRLCFPDRKPTERGR